MWHINYTLFLLQYTNITQAAVISLLQFSLTNPGDTQCVNVSVFKIFQFSKYFLQSWLVAVNDNNSKSTWLCSIVQLIHIQITCIYDNIAIFVSDISCLRLSTYKHIPQFLEHTNSSITLDLPAVEADPQCTSISMPTIEYIIFYGKIGNSNASKPDCGDFINCKNKVYLHTH